MITLTSCMDSQFEYYEYEGAEDKGDGSKWEHIAPIITKKCGGKSCHGDQSPYGVYVGNVENFKKDKQIVLDSIFVTKTMPKGTTLSDNELGKIRKFLNSVPIN